ncbi:hypothetical protein FO675_09415 [Riemerella anatipestifer]|uniref:hypothetical protein n=1 Tax=Riemerella anatipestifer TaxID=34085 RepID=UPI001AD7092C|nr:hypothetical protein [Riemerella anatipestifer]MBO4234507.1 hypothetical protein [Riemerella anatipestifer]
MKKILFIAPDYYGFNEVVYDGLKKYSNAKVTHVVSAYTQRYKYKHIGERIQNLFMKTFLGRNLKDERQYGELKEVVRNSDFFDQIIINRPDVLSTDDLIRLKSKTNMLKAFFWDSIEKIPSQRDSIAYFDKCFSFDSLDCEKYGFEKNTNFFFAPTMPNQDIIYDVLFLGTQDGRIDKLVKILEHLNRIGYHSRAFLYNHYSNGESEYSKSPFITITNKLIPFSQSYKISSQSRILLDLAQDNQAGLSFRPFEALGLQKKMITDNPNILNYDFYSPENICLIDPENIKISEDFFSKPYKPLDTAILGKYSLEHWIHNIIK